MQKPSRRCFLRLHQSVESLHILIVILAVLLFSESYGWEETSDRQFSGKSANRVVNHKWNSDSAENLQADNADKMRVNHEKQSQNVFPGKGRRLSSHRGGKRKNSIS